MRGCSPVGAQGHVVDPIPIDVPQMAERRPPVVLAVARAKVDLRMYYVCVCVSAYMHTIGDRPTTNTSMPQSKLQFTHRP